MLALVTCISSPPQSDTEKNEFLAPDFPADSSQFFRVHGFTSAVRQMPTAMHNPFAWTNVSSGKNACFAIWPHVGTKFFNSSHHFLSMDGWPGDAIFFLWGQPLKIIHKNSAKKGPAPWTLFLIPAPRPLQVTFFWLVKLKICGCTLFCKDKCIFSKKHMCCNLRARWHKILEFVPSCPICGWLAWWCDFFPVGPTFEDHPQVFSQKRSSPLNFIFDTCASASWSHLFWFVKLNICGCTPFARTNVFSEKKRLFCNLGALTQNSWIRPVMSYLWMIGLVMRLFSCGVSLWRLSRKYSVKKRSSPLDFIFDTCASASSSHFFGWWSWTCVSVPFCKDNCIFSKKNMCFANWARVDTKFLNSSRHVLSVDDWPGDATFFLWGQPLKIIRKYSVKKGPAPWILFLTPAPWPLEVTFFGWWRWTYVFVPFCKVM